MRSSHLLLVPVVLATFAAGPLPADTFAPKDGKFAVNFPGRPKETKSSPASPIGELKVYTATYATNEGQIYLTSYTDFPPEATKPEMRDTLYDGILTGLTGKDGKLVTKKEIDVGSEKLPGREFVVDKGKQQVKVWVVLRGNRLYQVAVHGPGEFVTGKDAAAFLDSFQLK